MRRLTRRHMVATISGAGVAGLLTAAGLYSRGKTTLVPAPQLSQTTTVIKRQDLRDERMLAGTLAYGAEQALESQLTGTLTWLPDIGTVAERGSVVFKVDNKPIILMYGVLPAFRELHSGTSTAGGGDPGGGTTGSSQTTTVPASRGQDVKQFKENLKALGYTGFTVNDEYSESTVTAVKKWQKSLGMEQTGTVELGRVYYTAGPVRIAGLNLAVGQKLTGPVLSHTVTTRMVTATVKAGDEKVVPKGAHVTVELPNGKQTVGIVQSVRAAPQKGDPGSDSDPLIEAQISLEDQDALNGVPAGAVKVRVLAEERKAVLAVPVAALLALAEGGHGLEVIEAGRKRIIPVTTGLFATGNVEITGANVHEGMVVGMAS